MKKIQAIIEKADDGGISIYSEDVNGAYGFGLTEQEAKEDFVSVLETFFPDFRAANSASRASFSFTNEFNSSSLMSAVKKLSTRLLKSDNTFI